MTLLSVRRALHALHAAATLVLLATALLLEFPDLRARLVGGYGSRIVAIHLWAGAAFVLAPLAALALAYRGLVEELRRRLGPPDPWRWRKSHIVGSIAAGVALAVSGVALWGDVWLPVAVSDGSRVVHLVFSVWIAVALPIHLFAARKKVVARVREWLGLEEPPDSFFDFDSD